jgi:DNA-binding GntR family transcriptional regulator
MIPDRQKADNLGTQAAQIIGNEILRGRFAPGIRLNEVRLADELALSRGPVREALRTLEREGLVVSLPNRGSFVQRVSPSDIGEILSVREVVEPFALEQAIGRRGHAIAGPLLEVMVSMRAAVHAGDWAPMSGLHVAFHRVLYAEAPGKILLDVWKRFEPLMRIYLRPVEWSPEAAVEHLASHERLAEVFITADVVAGRAAILEHLANARAKLGFPFSSSPSGGMLA